MEKGTGTYDDGGDIFSGLHVDLRDVNTRLAKYKPLIDAFAARHDERILQPSSYPYSEMTEDIFDSPYFRKQLKGNALVDVGAGTESYVRQFSAKVGARYLIEIEKYNRNSKTGWEDLSQKGLQIMRFHSDMLDALARLPDNFANVIMNGIDIHIISKRVEGEYRAAVFEEIYRITRLGGIFFGENSIEEEDEEEFPKGFKTLQGKEAFRGPYTFIFEKTGTPKKE